MQPVTITETYLAQGSGNCLEFSLTKRVSHGLFYLSAKIYLGEGMWRSVPESNHGFGTNEAGARQAIERLVQGDWKKNLMLFLSREEQNYLEDKERSLQANYPTPAPA